MLIVLGNYKTASKSRDIFSWPEHIQDADEPADWLPLSQVPTPCPFSYEHGCDGVVYYVASRAASFLFLKRDCVCDKLLN